MREYLQGGTKFKDSLAVSFACPHEGRARRKQEVGLDTISIVKWLLLAVNGVDKNMGFQSTYIVASILKAAFLNFENK